MINLNADDIRRIVIEALCDLSIIKDGLEIDSINFIDEVVKEEILLRKSDQLKLSQEPIVIV